MLKFIHAADIHLDSPMLGLKRYDGAPVDEVRGATRRALENLVALAIDEQAAFLLIAGDVYDGPWRDSNTGLFFIQQMTRLGDAGIPVLLIKGNHDAQSVIARNLTMPPNVFTFSDKKAQARRLEDIGVAVHGQSFATSVVTEDLSAGYPLPVAGWFNIGLLHTCADGREGYEPYAPCSPAALANAGYDYWALGHIHTREVLRQIPYIVFSGNLQGRSVRETGSKGASLVTVQEGGTLEVEHRPLDTVRWRRVYVTAHDGDSRLDLLDRVEQRLLEEIGLADNRVLAARVEITGSSNALSEMVADIEHIADEIRSRSIVIGGAQIWIEKVKIDRSRAEASLPQADLTGVSDILDLARHNLSDTDSVQALATELAELRAKIPSAMHTESLEYRPDAPDYLESMLPEVYDIIASRLLA